MNDGELRATTAGNDIFTPRVLVLTGVSGCGKTAVGRAVADQWGADFQDADDWHTREAVAKMASGEPLTDEDRIPWLERLRDRVIRETPPDGRRVLACSALRRQYRDLLREGQTGVRFVYLAGSQALIAERMSRREGHYMPDSLLDSQFAALEEPGPDEAVRISIDQPLSGVVAAVMETLRG